MLPVYQTIVDPPHGNCLQACIASILELSLEDVPNFMAFGSRWHKKYLQFLEKYGFTKKRFGSQENQMLNGYHLIIGGSPRGRYLHAVVGLDGKIIHDPYPNWEGEPLTRIIGYETIESLSENGMPDNLD